MRKSKRTVQVAGGDAARGVDAVEHPVLHPQLVAKCRDVFHSYQPVQTPQGVGLTVLQLQQCLSDMDIFMTENQAKDLIFAMQQSTSIELRNAEVEKESRMAATNTTTASAAESVAESTSHQRELILSFPLFLELLMSTMEDSNREREVEAAWRAMDADRDGVLGLKDVQSAMEKYASLVVRQEGAALTADEVKELLREIDFDNDGRVTLKDFAQALDTN
jgi:Ca2+-binding EF-hand superfamily protein